MLCMGGLTASAADADDILEYQGDRYVIHVDKMHPDSDCVSTISTSTSIQSRSWPM